jgi:predicted amidophosphoribosyltransferase
MASNAETLRAKREAARAAGVCLWCQEPATSGSLCSGCKAKQNERKAARREAGVCSKCPEPAEPGSWSCSSCKAKQAEAGRARRLKTRAYLSGSR